IVVTYSEPGNPQHDFRFPCSDFATQEKFDDHMPSRLVVDDWEFVDHFKGKNRGATSFPPAKQVYEGMKEQCRAVLEEEAQWEQARAAKYAQLEKERTAKEEERYAAQARLRAEDDRRT